MGIQASVALAREKRGQARFIALFLASQLRYLIAMPKPRVYVETTIPSFYHEARAAADIAARREWTRRWWDGTPERYER